MVSKIQFIQRVLSVALILLLPACGTLELGVEKPTTLAGIDPAQDTMTTIAPVGTVDAGLTTPSPGPTLEAPTNTPVPVSPLWVEYRDPRYGYGLALPCFWNIYPTQADAVSGTPSIRSYDMYFFLAHSVRSQWINGEWPRGTVKFDLYVSEDVDSNLSLIDAARQELAKQDFPVQSIEEVTVGSHTAALAVRDGEEDPSLPNKTYVFRLSPSSLLFFYVSPRQVLDSPEIQAILASLAASKAEKITLPVIPPADPVEGRAVYTNTQAGYCLAYPTEAAIDEQVSSQPTFLGKVANFKIERSLYDVGMSIDVRHVPEGVTLEEQVNAFLQQFDGQDLSGLIRTKDQLGGEPAEVIEGLPGRQGVRELFALHAGRLYHLTVKTSSLDYQQADGDKEFLYDTLKSSLTFLP
jgi:hypothetical protein